MRNIGRRESGQRFGEYRAGLFIVLADVDGLQERLIDAPARVTGYRTAP